MITENWEYRPDWLAYIVGSHQGAGRVELIHNKDLIRSEFEKCAKEAFIRNGFPARKVKTYLSIQTPEEGEGYAEQYPHIHYPLDGMTLVHYLQPGDQPAALDIFKKDQIVETIYPAKGLTVFLPHDVWHGVRKNNGTTDRIQFIATGLR